MSGTLLDKTKVTRANNAASAAQTAIETASIDMAGFDEITWLVLFGTITSSSVVAVKAQQSDNSAGSPDDWSDIVGSSVSVADSNSNKVVPLTIVRPTKRYVRAYITRTTANTVVDGVLAIQSKARSVPVTQASSVLAGETHIAPAEGTA